MASVLLVLTCGARRLIIEKAEGHAMNNEWPVRLWIEIFFGGISAALFAITLALPDWIERVFDIAPDHGDGSTEWAWAAGFAIVTAVLVIDAQRIRRRLGTASTSP
jgi:hypothetical protein